MANKKMAALAAVLVMGVIMGASVFAQDSLDGTWELAQKDLIRGVVPLVGTLGNKTLVLAGTTATCGSTILDSAVSTSLYKGTFTVKGTKVSVSLGLKEPPKKPNVQMVVKTDKKSGSRYLTVKKVPLVIMLDFPLKKSEIYVEVKK